MAQNFEGRMICGKCRLPLEIGQVEMYYQRQKLKADFPKCPRCGLVYISEELVKGRMLEIEKTLEDK
jgi:ribosomal protein S27AE